MWSFFLHKKSDTKSWNCKKLWLTIKKIMKREKSEKGKIILQKFKLPLVHGNCNEETAIKILKGQILSPSLSKKCRLLGKSLQIPKSQKGRSYSVFLKSIKVFHLDGIKWKKGERGLFEDGPLVFFRQLIFLPPRKISFLFSPPLDIVQNFR